MWAAEYQGVSFADRAAPRKDAERIPVNALNGTTPIQ